MPAGGRDLEGPAGLGLSSDFGEIDRRCRRPGRLLGLDGRRLPGPLQEPDDVSQRRGAHHAKTLDLDRLQRVRDRHHDTDESGARGRDGDRKDARGGRELPFQRELPREGVAAEQRARDLPSRGEDPHRDGEIQAGPLLAEVAGGQVDDQPPRWKLALAVADRGAHPLLRLSYRAAGESDHHEGRLAVADVDLDLDQPPFEAARERREHLGEHGSRLGSARAEANRAG